MGRKEMKSKDESTNLTENVENYKGDKDIDDILKDLGEVTWDSSGKVQSGKKQKVKRSHKNSPQPVQKGEKQKPTTNNDNDNGHIIETNSESKNIKDQETEIHIALEEFESS